MKTQSELINKLNADLKKRGYKTFCTEKAEPHMKCTIGKIKVRKTIFPLYISYYNDEIFVYNDPGTIYSIPHLDDPLNRYRQFLLRLDISNPESLDKLYEFIDYVMKCTGDMLKKYPSLENVIHG